MRLYPSAATRITRPLLTSDEAAIANIAHDVDINAYIQTGDASRIAVPDACPTVTFRPLTPRQAFMVEVRAGLKCPQWSAAIGRLRAFNAAHAEWVADGRIGPEPTASVDDLAVNVMYGIERAYAAVAEAVVSFSGIDSLDPLPPDWLDMLPYSTAAEIARMVFEASEVTAEGKASSDTRRPAPTPSASASGTAPPASETASAPREAIAADPSCPPCSTLSETPACLGATSTTAPTETRPGGWW